MLDLQEEQKKVFYTAGNTWSYVMIFPEIGLTIDNKTLHSEKVTVEEAVCEEEDLKLGGCIANLCEFEVSEIIANQVGGLEFGLQIAVNAPEHAEPDEPPESDNTFIVPMGRFRVDSAKRVDDKDYKLVTAYDALYDASVDVAEWYSAFFASHASPTVKELREALLGYLDIPFEKQQLTNDDVTVGKALASNATITGTEILSALCEINGGFGRMNRTGHFEVRQMTGGALFPEETLYPEESLYPEDTFAYLGSSSDGSATPEYRTTTYEEYVTLPITSVIIQNSSGENVATGDDKSNPYIITSNMFLYPKGSAELLQIGRNIYNLLKDITYRPNTTELPGLPYMEVGDAFGLVKKEDTVESFIFSRTLTGIKALRDVYEAKGNELRANELTVNDAIQKLQQDSADIQESVDEAWESLEETQEELQEFEEQTTVRFATTESSIEAEVSRAKAEESNLSSRIMMTAEEIRSEVSATYENAKAYADAVGDDVLEDIAGTLGSYPTRVEMNSSISQTASSITSSVSATYETKTNASSNYTTLSSQIAQTSNSITAEVTRAKNAEDSLGSRITITESNISSKVSKGDVVSEVNQSAEQIALRSNRLVIDSSYFKLDSNGYMTASGGTIANWTIDSSGLSGGVIRTYAAQFDYVTPNNSGNINITATGGTATLSSANTRVYGSSSVQMYLSSTNGVLLTNDGSSQYRLRPLYNGITDLGSSSYKWKDIYATDTTIQTSDRNEKKDIQDIPEEFAERLIDGTVPKLYRWKENTSERLHAGIIAQDVEAQLAGMGVSTKDFAALIKYGKEVEGVPTGEYGYGLRYGEYIAPIIKYCQILKRKLTEKDGAIRSLWHTVLSMQGEMAFIKQKIEGGNALW